MGAYQKEPILFYGSMASELSKSHDQPGCTRARPWPVVYIAYASNPH